MVPEKAERERSCNEYYHDCETSWWGLLVFLSRAHLTLELGFAERLKPWLATQTSPGARQSAEHKSWTRTWLGCNPCSSSVTGDCWGVMVGGKMQGVRGALRRGFPLSQRGGEGVT